MYSLPLFPMFKSSTLKSEVVELRDEAIDLKQKVDTLAQLKLLRATHASLTKEIEDLEKVHGTAEQPAAAQSQPSKE
jgi:hypothetical protein